MKKVSQGYELGVQEAKKLDACIFRRWCLPFS